MLELVGPPLGGAPGVEPPPPSEVLATLTELGFVASHPLLVHFEITLSGLLRFSAALLFRVCWARVEVDRVEASTQPTGAGEKCATHFLLGSRIMTVSSSFLEDLLLARVNWIPDDRNTTSKTTLGEGFGNSVFDKYG